MVGFRYNPAASSTDQAAGRRMLEAQPNPAHIALAAWRRWA